MDGAYKLIGQQPTPLVGMHPLKGFFKQPTIEIASDLAEYYYVVLQLWLGGAVNDPAT